MPFFILGIIFGAGFLQFVVPMCTWVIINHWKPNPKIIDLKTLDRMGRLLLRIGAFFALCYLVVPLEDWCWSAFSTPQLKYYYLSEYHLMLGGHYPYAPPFFSRFVGIAWLFLASVGGWRLGAIRIFKKYF